MTIETLLAVVAIVLVSGVIGFMLANTWKGRAVVRQRLPLETMLDAVKRRVAQGRSQSREQGSALMRFESLANLSLRSRRKSMPSARSRSGRWS